VKHELIFDIHRDVRDGLSMSQTSEIR